MSARWKVKKISEEHGWLYLHPECPQHWHVCGREVWPCGIQPTLPLAYEMAEDRARWFSSARFLQDRGVKLDSITEPEGWH